LRVSRLTSIDLAILVEVIVVTIRETAIAKIQQLPESLMQEIIDFIDFITRNHQAKTAIDLLEGDRSEARARWFEATDGLESIPEITPCKGCLPPLNSIVMRSPVSCYASRCTLIS